ncbi:MAG TPA: CBS domain-containing protein [Candidatus Dormibacteraeota bacterium]|nr:CBS domain-containing protein [Candidatus Dormibacteraeota bacterium]
MAPRAAARLETLGFDNVYEYEPGKEDWLAAGLPSEGRRASEPTLASVVRRDVPRFGLNDRVGPIRESLAAGGWEWAAIVNSSGVLLGRVRKRDIEDGEDPDAIAERLMDEGPSTYRLNVGLDELLQRMHDRHFDTAFVTDPDGHLCGLVTRRDIVRALDAHRKAS